MLVGTPVFTSAMLDNIAVMAHLKRRRLLHCASFKWRVRACPLVEQCILDLDDGQAIIIVITHL